MSTIIEQRLSALEHDVERLETIVNQGTDAGRYTEVVEKLMRDYGWTAEEAVANFNALLNSPEVLAKIAADEAAKSKPA